MTIHAEEPSRASVYAGGARRRLGAASPGCAPCSGGLLSAARLTLIPRAGHAPITPCVMDTLRAVLTPRVPLPATTGPSRPHPRSPGPLRPPESVSHDL